MPSARGSRNVLQAGALAAHTVLRQLGLHHFTSQQNEIAPVKPLLWEVLFSTEKIILYFKP